MRTTTKRNRSWAEGEALVAEFLESEQTQGEFCRVYGIAIGTLQYWLRKIAGAEESVSGAAGSGGFVELKMEPAGSSETDGRRDGREYELILVNGTRLIVRGGFELPEVSALVSVLEARA
jgi:hypothetical protein